jgi:hypothetical protein
MILAIFKDWFDLLERLKHRALSVALVCMAGFIAVLSVAAVYGVLYWGDGATQATLEHHVSNEVMGAHG